MKRLISIAVLMVMAAQPGSPYLFNLTENVRDHWPVLPVHWSLNPQRNPNIQGARTVADVMDASFLTWQRVPNAAVSAVRGTDSSKRESGNDGINLICFVCAADFSEEAETLAITLTTVLVGGTDSGDIIDADIFFNPNRTFTTEGTPGSEDLQTVATHEIGHLFGLSHTAIVRGTMFPFAFENTRTLSYDDVAGISTLYPAVSPVVTTHAVSGVVRLNNTGVFGAHVFAESQTGAQPFSAFNIRKSPISTLSTPDGSYRIDGLPPDTYIIVAEPLDLPVTNDEINGFAGSFDRNAVQTNFTTRWH
jgi:hypothetical protein